MPVKTIPLQIQLNQIENGWLVATPPEQPRIQSGQTQGPQVMTVEFGATYDDVCAILKKHWPLDISK